MHFQVMKEKQAKIVFKRPDEGGRKKPPSSSPYYATTKIDQGSIKFWSIVIYFDNVLRDGEYEAECKVCFLVNNAPYHILDEVEELPVYEGPKQVGQIILY